MNNRKAIQLASLIGLGAGVICSLYFVLLFFIGVENPFGQFRYLYLSIYALSFVLLFKTFRDRNEHRLKPAKGLLLGLSMLSTSSSVALGCILGWLKTVGKEVVVNYREASLQLLENARDFMENEIGKGVYEETRDNIVLLNATDIALDQAVSMIIWGVIFTFLFMLIFKN